MARIFEWRHLDLKRKQDEICCEETLLTNVKDQQKETMTREETKSSQSLTETLT